MLLSLISQCYAALHNEDRSTFCHGFKMIFIPLKIEYLKEQKYPL